MTLGTLSLIIAGVALVLTVITNFVLKAGKNLFISYLQNYTGALFIFSGWVKAVDPMGTAFKLEQYFAQFESTFSETWISFIAPLFPWLAQYAVGFSVAVIVFEIVLGLMLIIGASPKFTSRAFFFLVLFFTFLTGFTYLTGYVPDGVNFFQFGQWGAFAESNMKVTDCGCFGDFIKLEPKVSFIKDLILLVPGILFLFAFRSFHRLFSSFLRLVLVWGSTAGLIIYCISNFMWDEPHLDFRPFREGVNVAAVKAAETEAQNAVQVTGYRMINKSTGESVELPLEKYMEEYKNYPKEAWDSEQIKPEPAIPRTKISDFEIADFEGMDVTESILLDSGYHFMIVAYKVPYEKSTQTVRMQDTLFVVDTTRIPIPGKPGQDSLALTRRAAEVVSKDEAAEVFNFDQEYVERFTDVFNPIAKAARDAGYRVYGVLGAADGKLGQALATQAGIDYPLYGADDILLKTIQRSNPGLVLWHNGTIVKKWHIRKLPDFAEIQAEYLKGN